MGHPFISISPYPILTQTLSLTRVSISHSLTPPPRPPRAPPAPHPLLSSVPWIPAKVAEWIARVGLDAALDLTYDLTKKHSGAYFFDEMHGLADATGTFA